jgi:UPF0755 protein
MRRLALALLVLMIAAAAGGAWIYQRISEPYRGYEGGEQFVDIPPGEGSRAIGNRLIAAGVVRDDLTFRLALYLSGDGRRLRAGEYRFDSAMTPKQVIEKLVRGDVYVINVTFPEGLTIAEMAKIFESRGLGPAAAFVRAATDASPIQALDPAARDLEGYLFPETYRVPRRADAAALVRLMTARFEAVFTPAMRAASEAKGQTIRQIVTLASIVEKEASRPDERPIVAAVYTNRLRLGMPLQADPTVIVGLQRAGKYTGNIRRDDLDFDSPYNTYRYPGLPPGPIASPGRGALEAAVQPAAVDFLYFVSRNDGSHEFARTLAEHNRNVQKWQVQYFRDLRAGRAGGNGGAR